MGTFLNTSGTTYHLEELIKNASERLVLISPYLKLNTRIRELLEDKSRLKIQTQIIYGKSQLHPDQANWLTAFPYIRCSFCKNLHAKCYLSESAAIITSMNLYEFSQVNNHEMGILLTRDDDPDLYNETNAEAQRILRMSDDLKIPERPSAPPTAKPPAKTGKASPIDRLVNATVAKLTGAQTQSSNKISTSQLARANKLKTRTAFERLLELGYIERNADSWTLTPLGQRNGGETAHSKRFGEYIKWPDNLPIS